MHGEKRGKGARPFHNNEELGSDAMGGYSLEDYIYSLESRGERVTNNNIHSDPDVYGQLQQKERDLILAAELGKALLEKNEDLSKQNEKIVVCIALLIRKRFVLNYFSWAIFTQILDGE